MLEGSFPVIKGNVVVWVGDENDTTIEVYNIVTGQLSKLYPGDAWITPQVMLRENVLAYGAGDASFRRESRKSLYIIDLEQTK